MALSERSEHRSVGHSWKGPSFVCRLASITVSGMGVAASEGAWMRISSGQKDVVDQSISNGCIAAAAVQGLFHRALQSAAFLVLLQKGLMRHKLKASVTASYQEVPVCFRAN